MTAWASVSTACTIYGSAQTGAVGHRFIRYVQNSYLHDAFNYLIINYLKSTDLRHAPQVSMVKSLTTNYLDGGHLGERGAGRTSSHDFMASYASCDP